ncbi:glycosyltransferase family 61 protein [uncultured Mailhella sp.]|uniref:glycosyltransferase family 61 protein n=1 Tax=uncultured Mailhella sp. TaxID=1981031 RepID=UPI0025DDF28E|nr:glycosyltransferase family 61 protein [uncultured Mailhella sp.]
MPSSIKNLRPVTLQETLLHDVVILPDKYGFSGAWCDGKPVALAHMCRRGRQARRQAPYEAPVRIVEEPCIWGGLFQLHYGHFLIETMQSLYAFRRHPERRIVWRNASAGDITPWQHTLFHLTECDRNGYVFVNEPTLFRDMLFPVPGLMCDVWLTQEQVDAFAVHESVVQKGRRVWLSRSAVNSDNIIFTNERELEDMLASRGWLIVHPEHHSLEEQIDMLGSAEVVMGCIGSAFHTMLLLKNPGTRYIVINRMNGDEEAHNLQFDLIAKAKTDNYYVWEPPKHEARPLRRRKIHHAWPWYAFDIEAIRRELDARDDFCGNMEGCPGMTAIKDRQAVNATGSPILFNMNVSAADRLYYFYRYLRRRCRPIKDGWTAFQQSAWQRLHRK